MSDFFFGKPVIILKKEFVMSVFLLILQNCIHQLFRDFAELCVHLRRDSLIFVSTCFAWKRSNVPPHQHALRADIFCVPKW